MAKKEIIIFIAVIFGACIVEGKNKTDTSNQKNTAAPISTTNTASSKKPNDYKPCKISTGVFACLGFFLPCICLCLCGFTRNGVRGNSCASGYQSMQGNVAAGSCFSGLQSCAAAGFCTCIMLLPNMLLAAGSGTGMWYLCKTIVDNHVFQSIHNWFYNLV